MPQQPMQDLKCLGAGCPSNFSRRSPGRIVLPSAAVMNLRAPSRAPSCLRAVKRKKFLAFAAIPLYNKNCSFRGAFRASLSPLCTALTVCPSAYAASNPDTLRAASTRPAFLRRGVPQRIASLIALPPIKLNAVGKCFDFLPRRGIMAEIESPGIAKLVSRLVWERGSVHPTRESQNAGTP